MTQYILHGPDSASGMAVADTVIVPAGETLTGAGSTDAVSLSAGSDLNLIQIDGVLRAENGAGLHVVGDANSVEIGENGRAIASGNGIGVYMVGFDNALMSAGKLKGYYAAYINGTDQHIDNSGRMISTDASGAGIYVNGAGTGAVIGNSGRIRSAYTAILSNADDGAIDNSGRIVGGNAGISATGDGLAVDNSGVIRSADTGLFIQGSSSHIANSGRILGDTALHFSGDGDKLDNTGLIAGTAYGLYLSGTAVISNHGTISCGDGLGALAIVAISATAVISNRGLIDGDVHLGAASDHFENFGHGRVKGEVLGGGGGDTLYGAGARDRLEGNGGDDTISGGGGRDWLKGDSGGDSIDGGRGDDRLTGGADNDVFVFSGKHPGDDTIKDWTDGTNKISLFAYGLSVSQQTQFLNQAQHHHNHELVIDLSWIHGVKDGSITLHGFNTELTAGDFLF